MGMGESRICCTSTYMLTYNNKHNYNDILVVLKNTESHSHLGSPMKAPKGAKFKNVIFTNIFSYSYSLTIFLHITGC